jgi:hypothetical protein
MGSWTIYDNHPATGWANQGEDSYFGSTAGQVFSIRNAGDETDFRDNSSAYSWLATLRAMDFGDGGIRKTFAGIVTHFRVVSPESTIELKVAVDLKKAFVPTEAIRVDNPTPNTLLSDIEGQKLVSIKSAIPLRAGLYLQAQYSSSCYDTPVEISSVDYRVSAKSDKGITEARNTQS